MITFFAHVIAFIMAMGILSWRALVLMTIWNWFLPDFFHLPILTFKISVGITFLLAIIHYEYTPVSKPDVSMVIMAIIQPLAVLILASLVKMYL